MRRCRIQIDRANAVREVGQHGATLIELMITVAVIGVLVAIATPSYQKYRLKTNRPIGGGCLVEAQRRLETVYEHTNAYPTDLTGAGYASASPTCGDDALYTVSQVKPPADLSPSIGCTSSVNCVQVVAAPVANKSQVKDGSLRFTVVNGQTAIKDHQPFGSTSWVLGWDFQPGQ